MSELRLNFDNPGLQTGLDVGSIAADYVQQLIINRKRVFENAARSNDFKTAVFNQLNAYNDASNQVAVQAFRELTEVINDDLKYTYNKGISSVDTIIKITTKRRIEPQSQAQKSVLESMLSMTLGIALGAITQAKAEGFNQLLGITAQVDTSKDIYQEIDRVQAVYINKGIQVNSGNSVKELSAFMEFTERNNSQQLLRQAKGERSAQYGMHYIQISAHPSSCPLCVPWQLRVLIDDLFSDGKPDGKTPLASEAVDAGLWHFNCRHDSTVFIPGFDRTELQKKEMASPEETAKRYAIEQQQRHNERNIRHWKLREAAAMTERERQFASAKVQEWQSQQHVLRKIAKQEGVPFYRQYEREQIGGDTRPTIKGVLKSPSNISQPQANSLHRSMSADDVKIIESKIQSSSHEIQSVWSKYESKIEIGSSKFNGSPHFSPKDNKIYYNLGKTKNPSFNYWNGTKVRAEEPYQALFHEIGHNIDATAHKEKLGSTGFYSDEYKSTVYTHSAKKGYTLNEMLYEETNALIKAKEIELINAGQTDSVYDVMSEELYNIPPIKGGDLSDIIEGVTNGKITGTMGHIQGNPDYWNQISPSTEAFANMFSASIVNPQSRDFMKENIPRSYDIFEEILRSLL